MRGGILALALLTGATWLQAQNLAGVRAIAAGGNTSFALLSDGTVWTWGNNEYGQLGDGTLTNRTSPVRVSGLTDAVVISGRLAVKRDGTVWQWGEHLDPSTGAPIINKEPVQVSGLTEIVAAAGGSAHSLALRSDGTVWAWGLNSLGELGVGMPSAPSPPVGAPSTPLASGEPFPPMTLPGRATPVQVSGLTDMAAVATGSWHSLALKRDGTVWSWGENGDGLLGDGLTLNLNGVTISPDRWAPAQVGGLSDVVAVAPGYGHNLALKADGTVWAWGFNGHGQLGDGTTETRTTPVKISGLAGVIKIAAGDAHSMAVKRDGTVWVWGSNATGQLGDGTTADRLSPVQAALTGTAAVAGGQFHSLALKDDGTVWAWGRDEYGQLGEGTQLPQLSRLGPLQVGGVTGVRKIAAGSTHSLAVKDDGTVWAWGGNTAGELGDGTRNALLLPGRSTPAQVSGLGGAVAIAGASGYSLAVTGDGGVWKWGLTDYKQWPEAHASPARVSGLTGVVAVATGTSYHLAVGGDGSLWEWGFNLDLIFGPLNLDPALVSGLTEVEVAAAALGQNLALKRDGTVWEWGPGWGRSGRTPTRVSGLTDVVSVAAGCSVWWQSCHGLALKRDGTVWAWGDNESGQLGDGTTTGRTAPLPIGGLSQVVAIAARNFADAHDVAVKSDGTVWEWPTAGQSTPVQVAGLSGIVAIAEGAAHTLALRRDGTVWACGSNQSGQLGVETIVTRTTPVQVVAPAAP